MGGDISSVSNKAQEHWTEGAFHSVDCINMETSGKTKYLS
jgi:hypothetical protein